MFRYHGKNSQSSRATVFRVLRQIAYTKLFKKYTSGNFSYHKILANNLIFNDTCRIVARFKDYLIFDDNTEFLRRFYTNEESNPRLDRILTFYETYSKIFPNYMILKESKYLYRNIRKKQKMIDAVNEIKREEEENRKKMKQNNGKIDKDLNELFTKTVKEEIKTFQDNSNFEKYKNPFDSDNEDENENSISISVMNRKMFFENLDNKLSTGVCSTTEIMGDRNNSNSIHESFVANETNHSISGILNILNDNKIYINDLPKLIEFNNYSKNSQKLKNNQKKPIKTLKKNSPEKKVSKNNNQLVSSNNKLEKQNNKKSKKYEISSKQNNNRNISNTSLVNKNYSKHHYLSTTGFKKLSTPSTASGSVFVNNTEKNLKELNQYQNIIIPKGNTVININNNYYEQVASSTLPMGYYTNQNLKISDNLNNNNNSSNFKKPNTNKNCKNSKSNLVQTTEKKPLQSKALKKKNIEENINKNSLKHHCKQISQDFIYQKNQNIKNDKSEINNEKEEKEFQEKALKFGSLSPQPTITNADTLSIEMKKKQPQNKNFFTQNNDPNLITGNTKENDDDDEEDIKEREKLFYHMRDLIENKKKDNTTNNDYLQSESNPLLLTKKNRIRHTNNENENTFYYSNFSKYKTISNFGYDNQNVKKNDNESNYEENCFSNKDIMYMTNENLTSKKSLKIVDKENLNTENKNTNNTNNKNEQINKKQKSNTKFGFKKLHVKEKKNKTKVLLKKNIINNNNNTSSKLNKEKNKLFRKTNNNFKNNKNLFSFNHDNISQQSNDTNNKTTKKNKLNQRNKQDININNSEIEIPLEMGPVALSHSILYKSPNSKLTRLLMSQKKDDGLSENNTTTKIYFKGKIQNMKYRKQDLNIDMTNQKTNTSYNNYHTENKKNLTEHNNTIINNTNNNTTTHKGLIRTHNINNSDLRNKYKSFLLKKNKQQSCEIENQSAIQQKMNKELIERMNFIKKNNKNNFYQKYKENKVKLGGIKSYIENNVGSFDNLSNSNIMGNPQNYARNSVYVDSSLFQTPSTENKKLGLYKKVIRQKPKMIKTDKKIGGKKGKNFETPSTIKVNRSKFLEKVKDKFYDNRMTMGNFNSCFYHK